jgi:polysaccharide export outer membrane protein
MKKLLIIEIAIGARRRMLRKSVALIALFAVCCFTVRAQDQRIPRGQTSDLERENLGRVAASAVEIKKALLKDEGLLVELKRWVAKDATDQGQIVSDADLTDDAIFDRLETDVSFRSAATILLRRYGYLLPKVNPDSEIGKEHELLIEERTKWLAQNQEEELAAARRKASQDLEKASCDLRSDADCSAESGRSKRGNTSETSLQPGAAPLQAEPGETNLPNTPSRSADPLERAQGIQGIDETAEGFNQSAVRNSYEVPRSGGESRQNLPGGPGAPLNPNSADSVFGSFLYTGSPASQYGIAGMLGGAVSGEAGDLRLDARGASDRDADWAADRGPSSRVAELPLNRRPRDPALQQPAAMVRRTSPYEDIPSLYDMYVQAVPRPAEPRRFGEEVFRNGAQESQLIPMDLPAGPDYVVGPGDGLAIDLWGGVSQRLYRRVDREGRVSLPEVGPILVSGKSLEDVQTNVQQILRTQFRDVSADVSLARLRTIRVYEVGDVQNPGAYDISSLSTPLNALFAAGGPTPRGSLRIAKHYRGTQLVQVVDLYDLLLRGVKSNVERLENGDTVLVSPAGPEITVEGMVRRPAIYELKDEKTLASVLELAGGLLPVATLRHIEVQRVVSHEKQTMLSLEIPEGEGSEEITKKLESFEVQDGDRIRIFPISPYTQDAVYVEGHVVRPGRYSYHTNMRVTDALSSYKDLLPEPDLQYAEIIRLNAPDFRPSVERFNLADAFANPAAAPLLQPMDTVRIFSKFDFENPPAVSVAGDVRAPGTYRTAGQIRLSDAVHLAGGLAADAQTVDAQVFRYLPDGKPKIFSVNLSGALAGDRSEDIALEPRDRVLVHRSPDAAQPATVYAEGEVVKPGRYPLTSNMNVADLIRVGGGLKPSADTQAADLTNYEWKNQAKLTGEHEPIAISNALAGDPSANLPLHNGDVLTVRQLPGWNDLGASITLKGEVEHPGTYGIKPGERLSSVLERAGRFAPGAYPYGAVLERTEVRELEAKAQTQIMLRVKDLQSNLELLPETDPKQKQAKEMALQQYQATLTELSSNPPVGRVAIRISPEVDRWKNTAADVEVRAGDTLVVPKQPGFVMVTGQVFNPTAVSYRPGKSAKWYLEQGGGPTPMSNKKAIFVIRADGSVIGAKESLMSGSSLSVVLRPGDTVVVPEKAIGGGVQWQTVFLAAQVASAVVSSVFIAVHY